MHVGWSSSLPVLCACVASCGSPAESPAASQAATEATSGPTLSPLKDGVRFSPEITHPYLPLSSVRYAEFESDDEQVICEVQPATRAVAGVECLVLDEKEFEDGELAEISHNYFAQDRAGNVYYFGEDVDEYQDGRVVSHGGAWLVGKNATEPCLFLPATLTVGFRFKRENSPPDAEEFDRIDALDARVHVPAGEFTEVLRILEGDHAEQWKERKYYARGVGLIRENEDLELIRTTRP